MSDYTNILRQWVASTQTRWREYICSVCPSDKHFYYLFINGANIWVSDTVIIFNGYTLQNHLEYDILFDYLKYEF